ncbi:MAG: hypothetical protein IPG05_14345 [Gemmatimonadetes bacterium]|nr:hypothetical protein [Gemmatimonadota bacterium]
MAQVAAQAEKYPRMAAIGEYQMDERAEIELARSAAPNSVARDATILVLGPQVPDGGRRDERLCLHGGTELDGGIRLAGILEPEGALPTA